MFSDQPEGLTPELIIGLSVEDFGEGDRSVFGDGAVCSLAHCDRPAAVVEADEGTERLNGGRCIGDGFVNGLSCFDRCAARCSVGPDGLDEVDMFKVARAVVEPGVANLIVGDRASLDHTNIGESFTRAPTEMELGGGNSSVELACLTNDRELFLILGRFGKHAQVQHGPDTVGIVDDHIGIVENVAVFAVVDLVEVVDVLAARCEYLNGTLSSDQVHEVEVVAGLLHERAAAELVEAVPVVHLDQEREAVFANSDHLDFANIALLNLVE